MASITIRKLDEATKRALRVRAALNGRSMEEEARVVLMDRLSAVEANSATKKKHLVDEIAELFQGVGCDELELPPRDVGGRPMIDFNGPEFD